MDKAGFGVYVHWPFCQAKCPYCDFNSHVRHRGVDQEQFAGALIDELRYFNSYTEEKQVTSIFFGGGTPSLMTAESVGAVLEAVHRLWPVAGDVEITLEANPNSVEAARFRDYHAAGVNRISIGVQSLDAAQLKFLGRLHSADEARAALKIAHKIYDHVSFDMIYARPEQTPKQWRAELMEALALAGDHISLYQLTIEPGTAFDKAYKAHMFSVPDEDQAAVLYELTQEVCSAHGFPAYEASNHARPGAEARHNLTYWRYQDYIGAGPGAHGRVKMEGVHHATCTIRHPENWLEAVHKQGHGLEARTALAPREQAEESLMMGLRLNEGYPLTRFEKLAGAPLEQTKIRELKVQGFLSESEPGVICATGTGMLVLNRVIGELLAA